MGKGRGYRGAARFAAIPGEGVHGAARRPVRHRIDAVRAIPDSATLFY